MIPTLGRAVNLNVFVDESGTMPLRVDEGVFTVAAIATDSAYRAFSPAKFNRAKLEESLRERHALAVIVRIAPGPDYTERLERKFRAIRAASSRTAALLGSEYVSPSGGAFEPRNHIWSLCIEQAIALAVLQWLQASPVSSARVIAVSKTLRLGNRDWIERFLRTLPGLIPEKFLDSYFPEPEVELLRQRIRFGGDDVTLDFSSDDRSENVREGLLLAHHVAKWARESVDECSEVLNVSTRGREVSRVVVSDFTEMLLADLAEDSVRTWESRHGVSLESVVGPYRSSQSQ